MARGWESKSVEAQQDEGLEETTPWKRPEEREAEAKLQSLERSRARVARELEGATTEAHRSALQNALDFLDKQIEEARG